MGSTIVFGIPTIVCAKSILVGRHETLGDECGATAPLLHRGEVVGAVVRTRVSVTPVYVSPGDYMDLPTSVDLILLLTPDGKYRLPETTRRAHALVNNLRQEDAS